jgi:hypothetical protein
LAGIVNNICSKDITTTTSVEAQGARTAILQSTTLLKKINKTIKFAEVEPIRSQIYRNMW